MGRKNCFGLLQHYTVLLLSVMFFLNGFFPYSKPVITSYSNSIDLEQENCRINEIEPLVNRLVLVIIDALRLDFVTAENMPYTFEISNNDGCFLSAKVYPPTVTLPQIKSLTTGSISQFIDVVSNLFNSEKLHDSFLHRLRMANKKIVFYGDDTWLKLYPDILDRYEGVTSFFVNDFDEVDDNVTRNVMRELKNGDWDVMILHYLGLDHIGHVEGPFSALIPPKLSQMDRVIQSIHLESKKWNSNTLIAITGDHGMKDTGGHGGSSFEETNVPLIFSGITCQNFTVEQIDLTPTLSVLFGIDIPYTSIGTVMPNTIESMDLTQRLHVLNCNSVVLRRNNNFELFEKTFKNATIHYRKYLLENNLESGKKALNLFSKYINLSKENLIRSSSQQQLDVIIYYLSLVILSLKSIICCYLNQRDCLWGINDMFVVISLIIYYYFQCMLLSIIFTFIAVIQIFTFRTTEVKLLKNFFFASPLYCVFLVCQVLSLFSSSFIEEEQHIYYFFWQFFLFFLIFKRVFDKSWDDTCKSLIIIIALFRLLVTFNQVDDDWNYFSTILSNWYIYFFNLFFISMEFLGKVKLTFPPLFIIALFFSQLLKYYFQRSTTLYAFYGMILFLLFHDFDKPRKNLSQIILSIWILNSFLLLKTHNFLLLSYCLFASSTLKKTISSSSSMLGLGHFLLGYSLYFCQGHRNNFASVDIAVGYIGLSDYNSFIVMLQVFFHTYTFPLLCFLLANFYLKEAGPIWKANLIFRSVTLTLIIISLVIHRQHLFIWSVFAPKFIIELVHSLAFLLQLIFKFISDNNIGTRYFN